MVLIELRWADKELKKFITNVGLITSNGPYGLNVMACEWTYKISSNPGLIAISSHPGNISTDNIMKTKEFGVSIAATDQNIFASVAGNYSGKDYDKIKALEELGYKFYKAKKIDTLMVEGSVMNLECKVIHEFHEGDHILFIGEVVEREDHPEKESLAYHKGKYWKIDTKVFKPSEEELAKINKVIEKYKKS